MVATAHPGPHPVLPRFRDVLRRFAPQAIEATIVPGLIVLVVTNVAGAMPAIGAALAWTLLAALWRSVTSGQLTALSILAMTRLSVRSLLALAAGSAFLYFLQGSIGAFCVAAAFLVSVLVRRPLARRFADDVTDLPRHVLDHPVARRALSRISLMWGLVGLVHASVGLWLLVHLSTSAYVVVNTVLSIAVPGALIAISVAWFRRAVGVAHDAPPSVALALSPAGT